MSINSVIFIFIFLPVAIAIYYVFPIKIRPYVLIVLNFLFYGLVALSFFKIFLFTTIGTVALGRIIGYLGRTGRSGKLKKILFVLGILFLIYLLSLCKYTEILPVSVGISFFVFKSISYLADIYKNPHILSINLARDILYLTMFTQIVSGPLSRYSDLDVNYFYEKKSFDIISEGIYRFLIGLSKKVVIANSLSKITAEIFSTGLEDFSLSYAWLGAIAFSLQIFFDFSGYSDMAIGLTSVFGYKCPENFNFPYMTKSISEFWRRWHMTLGMWFRDYVYIPLGGNRVGRKKVIINLFIVWALTGIWHGNTINFLFWGILYFILITFEKVTGLPGRIENKIFSLFYRIFSLACIAFLWVIFTSPGFLYGLGFMRRMIYCASNPIADARAVFLIKDYAGYLIPAVVLSTPIVTYIKDICKKKKITDIAFKIVMMLVIIVGTIWSVSLLVSGQNNPFVYENF